MRQFALILLLGLSLPFFAHAVDAPSGAPVEGKQSRLPQEPEAQDATPDKKDDKKADDKKAATADTPVEFNEEWTQKNTAILQGLNKVTAKTSEIKVVVGKLVKFGNLEISVEKCVRGPDDEKIENVALLLITDEIPGQEKHRVFHSWMFSSSPAISALEHPIYDVILLSCQNQK